LKKLKPDEKITPSLSVQEIHRRSSGYPCKLVEPFSSILVLTFDVQVKHVTDRKRTGELLGHVRVGLGVKVMCGRLGEFFSIHCLLLPEDPAPVSIPTALAGRLEETGVADETAVQLVSMNIRT